MDKLAHTVDQEFPFPHGRLVISKWSVSAFSIPIYDLFLSGFKELSLQGVGIRFPLSNPFDW